LFDMTAPDFTPLYQQLRTLEELPPDASLPEDATL
jgi:hypothetical protein